MKIKDVQIGKLKIPLKRPFKTALRTVYFVEDIVVKLFTHSGLVGYGSAAPTLPITGETTGSIAFCILKEIKPKIIGMELSSIEHFMSVLHSSIVGNTSALSAVDMAFFDLWSQSLNLPLYQYLGGYRQMIFTDITISANTPDLMVADALLAVADGFTDLKLKVGKDPQNDVQRVQAVRTAVGEYIKLAIDANQGLESKQAVKFIHKLEEHDCNIEFVEQPTKAHKLADLLYVTQNVNTDILADESVFSPTDALTAIQMKACNLINIKLAKAGGIYMATKILNIAEAANMECLVGCMLESPIAVTAAAHFAAAKKSIVRCDLDSVALISENPVVGSMQMEGNIITLNERSTGLGIKEVLGVEPYM